MGLVLVSLFGKANIVGSLFFAIILKKLEKEPTKRPDGSVIFAFGGNNRQKVD
jgi:hypothetical protein